ncbi:MAG TPA: two-component sensor histidine kinase [Rhizobiales bacterium]|nr:two-component sensor histidine kinase [Hyphomicrobiales bacterium]
MSELTNNTSPGPEPKRTLYWHFNRFLERHLPEGLYPRSLIIIIVPMVLLQSLMIYFVLEQHWSEVTKQLSRSVARDMALVVAMYEDSDKSPEALKEIESLTNQHLKLGFTALVDAQLPERVGGRAFSLLGNDLARYLVEKKLTKYLANRVDKPFRLDLSGQTRFVDARIMVDKGLVFRFLIEENRVSAPKTFVLLASMIGSSLILIVVAIAFLRKQVDPIVRLANAAKDFGMGREVVNFKPSGATEVKSAARAFLHMKDRIARHVEQRTAMLAGVSHDLRTILTRFKLELAFLGNNETVDALKQDVNEMQDMLEGYMSFVKGDGGETTVEKDITEILKGIQSDVMRSGNHLRLVHRAPIMAMVKPDAFKRLVVNLVNNAVRFGDMVELDAEIRDKILYVYVDDNGPGIDKKDRDDVFRPFVRLDQSRNQDSTGTGLGLAIARDIANSHGGRVVLGKSRLGGLRAIIEIPV